MTLFTALSAFPITPADDNGVVDADGMAALVDRLASAQVPSVSVLGSTGGYAYLDRDQRSRAVSAAVEAAAGRVPVVVGVGAMRTNWACELAVAAEKLGASGLLLAPMSYATLTEREVEAHFKDVAASTGLPLCIYNNPSTTNFSFSHDLIGRLAKQSNVVAIKMPALDDHGYPSEIAALRAATPPGFKVGYSGDWCAAGALLAGADAWHSVIAGILPKPALQMTDAAQRHDLARLRVLDEAFSPMWALFHRHGSMRLIYDIAEMEGLKVGDPPSPLQKCCVNVREELEAAVDGLRAATATPSS